MTSDNKINKPFSGKAKWIWSQGPFLLINSVGETIRLRRVFDLGGEQASLIVHVSADAEYILYCNGKLVGRGPAKGDIRHQFYDTYDLPVFSTLEKMHLCFGNIEDMSPL